MKTYYYSIEKSAALTKFKFAGASVKHNYTWIVYDSEGNVLSTGESLSERKSNEMAQKVVAPALRADEVQDLFDRRFAEWDGTMVSQDNDFEFGLSADSHQRWEERKATTPLTRYVEDEFGEIVQETEIIVAQEDKPDTNDDSGLIPRPSPQDDDSGLIPRIDVKRQIMRVRVSGSDIYQLAEIVDGVCVKTWLWSRYDIRGFWVADIAGWTVDQLRGCGFVFGNR